MNQVTHQIEENIFKIVMQGEITLESIETDKADILQEVTESDKPVLIDMSNVSFMDSGAIGFLVSILKNVNERKKVMAISGAEGQPRIVLRMVGIDEHVRIYDNNEEAILSIKAKHEGE